MKFTLDRFEEGMAVFLKFPEEIEQLLIEKKQLQVELDEGDIVEIIEYEGGYTVKKLEQETNDQKRKIEELMEKLLNKNHRKED